MPQGAVATGGAIRRIAVVTAVVTEGDVLCVCWDRDEPGA